MWSKLKRILPVAGIIILAYVILKSGPEKIAESFLSVNAIYIMPALLIIIPYFLLQTYKWKYILDRQGIRLGFGYLTRLYMIGTFYSTLTPGKLGTFIRIGYIKDRTGKSLGECSSSVVLDKAIDIMSLFAIAIIGIALFAGYMLDMASITVTAGVFVLFVLGVVLFMKKSVSASVLRIVHRFLVPVRMKSNAKEAFDSFYSNMPRVRMLLIPLIVTIISWLLVYTSNYLIALSLGINIPYHMFVTIFPIATLVGLIPITISGWGTREAALIGLFSSFGALAGGIIAMSILSFVLSSLLPAVLGAGLSVRER